MPHEIVSYTINDLSRLTGLNVRTIRYYIAQGLIPASGESGPGAHYGQGHLDRLRLIKRLQGEYLPNAEIRRRLEPLSDADVAGLIGSDSGLVDPSRPTTSALEYVRGLLGWANTGGPVMPPPSPSMAPLGRGPRKPMPIRAYAPDGGSVVADAPDGRSVVADAPVTEATDAMGAAGATPGYAATGIASGAARPPSRAAAHADNATTATPAPAGEPAPAIERSQWERLQLAPNIELHVRRPLSRIEQRRVERLITIARQVLGEDQS